MSPIAFLKNVNEITIEINQRDGAKKVLRTRHKRSGLIIITDKQEHQRLINTYQNTCMGDLEIINNTVIRSLDSYDKHTLLPISELKRRINSEQKGHLLIKEE